MKEYLTLTAEKFHLRTAHSILHGYWTVELGGVNQVVHLWEYGNKSVSKYVILTLYLFFKDNQSICVAFCKCSR